MENLNKILINITPQIRKNIIIDSNYINRSYIESYYNQADLFVLPSHSENFGISIIESIYSGTPSLITKNVDIHEELMEHNLVNIIEELNPLKLSQMIIISINDYLLKSTVKKKGKEVIKKLYSWEKIAYKIDQLTYKLFIK